MAGPWEEYQSQSQPASEGPWTQYAGSDRTVLDKLTGQGGERYQTWPERLARSIASGVQSAVTLPGDVASGDVAVNPADPRFISRTLDFAATASPIAPRAMPALAGPKVALPTSEELRAASDFGYNAARNNPLTVSADSVKNLAATIQHGLEQKGIIGEFAPDTYAVLKQLQRPEAGAYATGSNLISAREALRNASQNFTNPREAKAANEAIALLDRFIEKPPAESVLAGSPAEFSQIARDARGNYAASRRSDQITGQLEEAQGNAAAANSGQNIGNAIRQRFNAIVKSDKQSSGFSPAEIEQAKAIRDGTALGNAARFTGNLLGGGGGLGSVISSAAGAAAFGPFGAALPIAGYGLKKLSDASINRQVKILDEMTRARSPLAQSSGGAMSPADQLKQILMIRSLLASQAGEERT